MIFVQAKHNNGVITFKAENSDTACDLALLMPDALITNKISSEVLDGMKTVCVVKHDCIVRARMSNVTREDMVEWMTLIGYGYDPDFAVQF